MIESIARKIAEKTGKEYKRVVMTLMIAVTNKGIEYTLNNVDEILG